MDKTQSKFIGVSQILQEVEREIECAARSDAKVLITGESGVGKEVVARLIHQGSHRSRNRLVTINCAGVPDSLLETELFGHVRGSFTDAYRDKVGWLEQAQGGTIFMDEVGEMSLRMQALLLRFLESGEIQRVGSSQPHSTVNVRVIAATNRNLSSRIAERSFREDLYYRLNVIHIVVPPLRERRDDIAPLFEHFVQSLSEAHGLEQRKISKEALGKLVAYEWPGNVRELKNVAERVVIRAASGSIMSGDLPREITGEWSGSLAARVPTQRPTPELLFERMCVAGESFWSVVYEPFMSRDLTRADLRAIIARGLEQTKGSYKLLIQLFNMPPSDYKRVLSFLRKYECHMPFQHFRALPANLAGNGSSEEAVVRR